MIRGLSERDFFIQKVLCRYGDCSQLAPQHSRMDVLVCMISEEDCAVLLSSGWPHKPSSALALHLISYDIAVFSGIADSVMLCGIYGFLV